jgi:transposase
LFTNARFFSRFGGATRASRCMSADISRRTAAIAHRGAHRHRVREALEARGATPRYLPKYSPDLNPIEMSLAS